MTEPKPREYINCMVCGYKLPEHMHSNAKTCSPSCRIRYFRNNKVKKMNETKQMSELNISGIDFEIQNKTQSVEITPLMAANILSLNTSNRNYRKHTIYNYYKQMINNEWRENNPQPIVIRRDGHLLDGQHRLMAVIKSDLTLKFNVYIEGDINKTTLDLMVDMGLKRNYSDLLNLNPAIV